MATITLKQFNLATRLLTDGVSGDRVACDVGISRRTVSKISAGVHIYQELTHTRKRPVGIQDVRPGLDPTPEEIAERARKIRDKRIAAQKQAEPTKVFCELPTYSEKRDEAK